MKALTGRCCGPPLVQSFSSPLGMLVLPSPSSAALPLPLPSTEGALVGVLLPVARGVLAVVAAKGVASVSGALGKVFRKAAAAVEDVPGVVLAPSVVFGMEAPPQHTRLRHWLKLTRD